MSYTVSSKRTSRLMASLVSSSFELAVVKKLRFAVGISILSWF